VSDKAPVKEEVADRSTLLAKIKSDLEKSGFGSEMRALQRFTQKGWSCTGGNSFFDNDENISREFDIQAYRCSIHEVRQASYVRVSSFIVAEVKKSDRPWVVFKQAHQHDWRLQGGWTDVLFRAFDFPDQLSLLVGRFSRYSLSRLLGWSGHSIHESFKDPNQPSRWYSAFVTAVKAAEHVLETNADPEDSRPRISKDVNRNPPDLYLVQPIVVLDGLLFKAELNASGQPEVEEIDCAEVEFVFRSQEYRRSSYKIPVITLAGLDSQIDRIAQRHEALFDGLVKLYQRTVAKLESGAATEDE
jgi:hypothetical protein